MLATITFWFSDSQGLIPAVGASGAVAAVLGGYAVTYPSAKVRTLIFFVIITIVDLPALVVLGIWFAMQVFSGMMGLWGVVLEPVAFWAHIGGFVAGIVLMPVLSLGASPPGTDWRKETEDMFRFDDPRLRQEQ
jgi:membrane associated rhomboid family serine protease